MTFLGYDKFEDLWRLQLLEPFYSS